ncbi:MAG: hypothetical protein K6B65_03290 [Bacilli bacterium]|nr:hypothetical protein [Bacilli bacterium]
MLEEEKEIDLGEEEEEEDEDIDGLLLLERSDGAVIRFKEIYRLSLDDRHFVLAQPIPLLEGMKENEAICLEITSLEDGDERYDVIVDEDVINKVFGEYVALINSTPQDA